MLRGQAQQRREVTLKIVLFAMISAQGRAVSLIAQTIIMGTLINTGMIIRMPMITGMITGMAMSMGMGMSMSMSMSMCMSIFMFMCMHEHEHVHKHVQVRSAAFNIHLAGQEDTPLLAGELFGRLLPHKCSWRLNPLRDGGTGELSTNFSTCFTFLISGFNDPAHNAAI